MCKYSYTHVYTCILVHWKYHPSAWLAWLINKPSNQRSLSFLQQLNIFSQQVEHPCKLQHSKSFQETIQNHVQIFIFTCIHMHTCTLNINDYLNDSFFLMRWRLTLNRICQGTMSSSSAASAGSGSAAGSLRSAWIQDTVECQNTCCSGPIQISVCESFQCQETPAAADEAPGASAAAADEPGASASWDNTIHAHSHKTCKTMCEHSYTPA